MYVLIKNMKNKNKDKESSFWLDRVHQIECWHCGKRYHEGHKKCDYCGTENDEYCPRGIFKVNYRDRAL